MLSDILGKIAEVFACQHHNTVTITSMCYVTQSWGMTFSFPGISKSCSLNTLF